ncbi:MAG TPA: hypothetical protein VFG53_13015 [Anaeromyxobacter sp.]|nr:hypothetical protein [Anaeromyxobacter sp.]
MAPVSTGAERSCELVLPLLDPDHLFNAPRIDPLSKSPAEALGIAGVEYLLEGLHLDRKRQGARSLVLILPATEAARASSEKLTLALHRQI